MWLFPQEDFTEREGGGVKWTEENHKTNSNFQSGGDFNKNCMDILETVVKAL
jgi:hypothetical protein